MLRFLLVFILLYSSVTYAQSDSKARVIGSIVSENGEPIPYASVAAYSASDSALAGGSASDNTGNFEFQLPEGEYYAVISFLSFQSYTTPTFSVNSGRTVALGKNALKENSQLLDEVEITSEKSTVELHLDKRVFNVGKDLSNAGASASDILQNVPSVEVDVEGNVSLRGSENVRILIDGKPSSLTGGGSAEALRMLQGNMIEKVEVITNPSSRYEAEGEAGIINIVLKKEQQKGVNGAFEISAGYPTNHGFTYSLNFRRKAYNIFSSYGIQLRNMPGVGESNQRYVGSDTSYRFASEYTRYRGGLAHVGRLGTDFYLNPKNTLTLSAMVRSSRANNPTDLTYTDLSNTENIIATTNRYDVQRDNAFDLEGNANYKKTFAQKGREWTMSMRVSKNYDSEVSRIVQTSDDIVNDDIEQRSFNTEHQENYMLQSDYIHPVGNKGKFELGLRGSARHIRNDFSVESDTAGVTTLLSAFSNVLNFQENIGAVYTMYSNTLNKLNYQLGMRAEYTFISTALITSPKANVREYVNPFPSAHLSYELSQKHTVQISYSRRISRPSYRELIPFYMFSDPRNYMSGNPNLNPEFSHSLEAGHLLTFEKGTLLTSVYYRHANGVVERIVTTDSAGLIQRFPVNLSARDAYGIELTTGYEVAAWIRFNGSINLYRAVTIGSYNGQRLFSDTYTAQGRASANIKLPENVNFQISWTYQAPRITPQGRMLTMQGGDLGLNRDFFNGKATLTLNVRDILNSRKMRTITETATLYSENTMQWHVRQFGATFTYRLNQKKDPRQRGNGMQNGEGDFDM